jgi:signal transduction histidine kinase
MLLNNAAKYMEDKGKIQFSASKSNSDQVVVSVKDRGIGIVPGTLPHVFDMLFQADSRRNRRGGGLGIGLTLARRLIEMHGGTIEAKSDGVGKGMSSSCACRLPRTNCPS